MAISEERLAEISGEELYRLFQSGDEAAFEKLVVLYRKSLTQYINGLLEDRSAAEELMIDTFAELAAGANYREKSSLKTYLFAIAKHLASRQKRKNRRIATVPFDDMDLPSDATLETDYLRGEKTERVRAAMRALKPEYSEVLRLVYFESMSYADAGKIMGKTGKQIKNLVYSSKVSVKKILDGEEMD